MIRIFKVLTMSILATSLGFSQTMETIPLWPAGQVPNDLNNAAVQEKSETASDGITRISNVKIPTLTVYRPAKPNGTAVMICPGGGYWILAWNHEGIKVAEWLNALGITAFILKYRLPDDKLWANSAQVPLADAMQGMKLIRRDAQKYGIVPTKIGVMGFSAGGHLASTLATHWHQGAAASEEAKPNFSILMYPVITYGENAHRGSAERQLGKNATRSMIEFYSNERQVTEKTPPSVLFHSTDDLAVPVENSLLYYSALKKYNISAEMHVYPTGGHGFGMAENQTGSVKTWPDACKKWLAGLGLL